MTAFWAIAKLTFRAAFRSQVFLVLLGLLVLAIVALPNTVTGDGTAFTYIKVALQYSLGAVSVILAISTLWLGCFALAGDLESHQLHLVAVKPVSRVTVWLGKCAGVAGVHLLLLAAAATMVYGFIQWQFRRRHFDERERERIEQEVMVGRRVTFPETPDLDRLVDNEYRRRLAAGGTVNRVTTSEAQDRDEVRKQVLSRLGEVRHTRFRYWHFTGIRPQADDPVYFRYRAYRGEVTKREQGETVGQWAARLTVPEDPSRPDGPTRTGFMPFSPHPEKIPCGVFREDALKPFIINRRREAIIGFVNLDPERKSVFFQVADGPQLLVRVTGFEGNYLRAVLMIAMKLIFLSGLGCAAGAVFSASVAVFISFAYLLIGVAASIVVGFDHPAHYPGPLSLQDLHDLVGRLVSEAALFFINPIHRFEVADQLAGGELIEWSFMARIFAVFMLLKGMPLFLAGIWLYRRRELGLVARR